MKDPVECRSESSYPDKPLRLTWEGTRREVAAILGRSREPQGYRFRVRTTDGLVFDLDYSIAADAWRITPVQED